MKTFLSVAIVACSALAGCNLYFGDHHSHGDDTPTGSGSSGYACTSNTDCAAGCYCDTSTGTCEEGGFCSTDADCPSGFHCDADRSSCEADPGCTADTDCASGQYCDTSSGTCTDSCTCNTDADAQAAGFGWCDTTRKTCMTGENPNGECAGDVTCNTAAPACAEGQVPLILDGCYTGQCGDITSCAEAPTCSSYQHQDDCTTGSCTVISIGHDCTKPDGSACTAGDSDCTCASFTYGGCEDHTAERGPIDIQ
ncbi:MAG TPA: hypothetical protein VGM88_28255 [Kofleriaceae bacterium]